MARESEAARVVYTWLRERDEAKMIDSFDRNLVPRFSVAVLKASEVNVRNSKHRHKILHELVKSGKAVVLEHLVSQHGFDMNIQRPSDLCTPLHLALWTNQANVADVLLRLGADPTIRNRYGEDALAARAVEKPIKAKLQGAQNVGEILGLVDTDLSNFTSIDTATAFFRLAVLTANYDAEFCKWDGSVVADTLCEDTSFRRLADACIGFLCRPSGDDGAAWVVILSALARRPDRHVIDTLATWITNNDVPFLAAGREVLVKAAWSLAKIHGGHRLWEACYVPLGNELSAVVEGMIEADLASVIWSFAKAGFRPDGNHLKHDILFLAVARSLENMEMESAHSVSIIAWGFAKLRVHSNLAMDRLAREAFRLMPGFGDQHVANMAWALARLNVADVHLFAALLDRAKFTLYHDFDSDHVKMSRHVKLLHWYQIYTAFRFCRDNCPRAIDNLDDRLGRDLLRIASGEDVETGLSEGSGLESVRDLAQLDAMIAEMDADGNDIGWTYGAEVPADSMEFSGENTPDPQVADENAASASHIFESRIGTVKIAILKFSRSPGAFKRALLEGPELQDCRDALTDVNMSIVLPSAAKIFVRPEHYEAVRNELRGTTLYSSNVVVAEEFEHLVLSALGALSSNSQIRITSRLPLDNPDDSWDMFSTACSVGVTRTCVYVSLPSPGQSDM